MKNLEFATELNGLTFAEMQGQLSAQEQTENFLAQPIRTIVVRNWNNPAVLYQVFVRLNQGSLSLSPQELRQALYPSDFTRWVNIRSVGSAPIQKARRIKQEDFRMRDAEMLLRYVAFAENIESYAGNLRKFLDEACISGAATWNNVGEQYIEQRCLEIAKAGCHRLTKSQPTATGRALIVWSRTQDRWAPATPVYIHELDAISDLSATAKAIDMYSKAVKKSHGIGGDDLRNLVFPLGLRESQVPEVLVNSLDALAEKRNPASHTYVKSQDEPELETQRLNQILVPLRQLDHDLATVCDTFPVAHL